MRVALLQLDLAWQDARTNRAEIQRRLAEFSPAPGSFVLAPEMADTGFVSAVVHDAAKDGPEFAGAVAARHRCWYLHGGTERGPDGHGRNALFVADPAGGHRGTYWKIHPFGFGDETRGFRGGDRILVLHTGDAVISTMICYDLRFPEVWRLAALAGAEVFFVAANWPAPRAEHWRALCKARAIENQAFVVACNRVGRDPNVAYSGGSLVVSPQGEVIAEGGSDASCLGAELDLGALREWRERFPALRDLRRRFLGRLPCAPIDSTNPGAQGH